ncbi:hypothetical protein, partial [Pseudoalteromonas marina]|nr:hypothetical protein [Pseudoalteromonas marina]
MRVAFYSFKTFPQSFLFIKTFFLPYLFFKSFFFFVFLFLFVVLFVFFSLEEIEGNFFVCSFFTLFPILSTPSLHPNSPSQTALDTALLQPHPPTPAPPPPPPPP